MPALSEAAANTMFAVSNLVGIGGALLVVLGAWGIFHYGGVRDDYTRLKISDNERKTAEATESNTKLQIELEKERIQRLLLEQKIEPRKLSDSQRATLASKIRSAGWKTADIIWVGVGEPEYYARDLGSAFQQAGVTPKVHTLGPFIPSAWGLLIVETTNETATRLKALFDDVHVDSTIAATNDMLGKKDYPVLVVGQRQDLGVPDASEQTEKK